VPLPNVYVIANQGNAVTRVKPGQRSDITVDSFAHETLQGAVGADFAGLGSQFALLRPVQRHRQLHQGREAIPVRIALDSDRRAERSAGMSVLPTIHRR